MSSAELADLKEQMAKIAVAWKAGDSNAMEETILHDPAKHDSDAKPLLGKMFDDRQVNKAPNIESYLQENDPCFVIVGAGHLVGAEGTVNLLEDKKC